MKSGVKLVLFSGIALFCLYVLSIKASAQQNDSPKSLIQLIKPVYFDFPVECQINENCWVMNYVDIGPEDGKNTDLACLNRTYDGHKGTDIAIRDEKAMQHGVPVLAPLDGTIKRLRDGEIDQWSTPAQLDAIKQSRKECGNAIMMEHAGGWQTIYCHLKKNSIRVKENQKVQKGDVLAHVGLSGFTEFPHLHFGVVKDNKIIDPFTGQPNDGKCNAPKNSLWNKELVFDYQPLSISGIGFSNKILTLENIDRNSQSPKSLPEKSDILTFWVNVYGARQGDVFLLEIKDPNGKTFVKRNIEQPKTRARQFYFTGKKLYDAPLMAGAYTGHVKIIRQEKDKAPLKWERTIAVLISP